MTITSRKIFERFRGRAVIFQKDIQEIIRERGGAHDNNIQKDIQKFRERGCNIAVSYINAISVWYKSASRMTPTSF